MPNRRRIVTGPHTGRQLMLSFAFLFGWGLIAQSDAMIGFGLVGFVAAWILVKRSALSGASTNTDHKH